MKSKDLFEANAGRRIVASTSATTIKVQCHACNSVTTLASDSIACPHCGEMLIAKDTIGAGPSGGSMLTASTMERNAILVCEACGTKHITDYPKSKEADLVCAFYCPTCSGEDLRAGSEDDLDQDLDDAGDDAGTDTGDAGDDGAGDDPDKDKDKDDQGDPDDNADADADADVDSGCAGGKPKPKTVASATDDPDKKDDQGDADPDPDADVDDGSSYDDLLTLGDENQDDDVLEEKLSSAVLEAAMIGFGEPTWVVFKNGEAVARLPFSAQTEAGQLIFDKPEFIQSFSQYAAQTSLLAAVEAFGGTAISSAVVTRSDLRDTVVSHVDNRVVPRLTECIMLAATGSMKGLFPETTLPVKDAMFDELAARGLQAEATSIIEAAFEAAGPAACAQLLAKTMELYAKSDAHLTELRTIVAASAGVKLAALTAAVDTEHQSLRSRLAAGNLPISAGAFSPEPVASGTTVNVLKASLF